jgi:hypothetical protein
MVMNNHHTKFEVPRPKRSLVISRKPFGLQTDRPTDRQTDRQTNAKQYIPTSLKGGIYKYAGNREDILCTKFSTFHHLFTLLIRPLSLFTFVSECFNSR